MRKICAALLTFWMAACHAFPSPNPSQQNSPAALDITPASPTVFSTTRPTLSKTEMPIFPPARILPALQGGNPVTLSSFTRVPYLQMIDAQIGWSFQLDFYLRPGPDGQTYYPREGYILRSINGGKTWRNVSPPTGAYSPGGFFALDANHAWASENVPCCTRLTTTRVWRTTDGGQTWNVSQPVLFDSLGTEFYLPIRMQFVDQNTGWLLVTVELGMTYYLRNTLFHTTDGGDTWKEVNSWHDDLGTGCAAGLAFIGSTIGWYGQISACDARASMSFKTYFAEGGWKVQHTTDGGNSFAFDTMIPIPPGLQQLESTNPDLDCGESSLVTFAPDVLGIEWDCRKDPEFWTVYSYFSLTSDAGHTWKTWKSSGNEYFIDATRGWRLLSPGQLQQTTDGGSNWVTLKMVSWESAQFDFISKQEGWALVSNADSMAFIHTRDGGKTWEEIKPVIASP